MGRVTDFQRRPVLLQKVRGGVAVPVGDSRKEGKQAKPAKDTCSSFQDGGRPLASWAHTHKNFRKRRIAEFLGPRKPCMVTKDLLKIIKK